MIFLPIQATDAVAHTFSLRPEIAVRTVNLAGTFNNWDRQATPMTLQSDGKTYSVTLKLDPGKYQYKFVLNGEIWITDPKGKSVSDGNGNTNTVLFLIPNDYATPASPKDGRVSASALRHETEIPYFNYDRGRLTVSLRVRPGDLASAAVVVGKRRFPMSERKVDELYSRMSASIPWDRKTDLRYFFELKDGRQTFTYSPDKLSPSSASQSFVVSKSYQPFVVPNWVEKSVIYQIFPDRFDNGDLKNDPAGVMPWNGKPEYFNRFGGDIAGVEKHLDYLSGLGVSCIYFNPIFKAGSNHRYDTIDYFQVDPEFGTNEELARLTRELKAKGMRTVLDGVFNHTSVDFNAFADVRKNGADSKYTSWYTFHSFPVRVEENPNYVAWFGFSSLPKINVDNPETRDYLLGVPKYWDQHATINGWRLDVANEVSMNYWRSFRKVVKGIDPDNWIVGEEWGDASAWLKGDQWDSVMNYRFRSAALGFISKEGDGSPTHLLDSLFHVYDSYAPQVSRNMMNLLGSHDTPRILTLCGDDRDLAKLGAILQFTWVGTPSIYYGDELGMDGGPDPMNRKGMRWDLATPKNDMLALYRKLVALRNSVPVLQSGDPVRVMADDQTGIAAFARVLGKDCAVVALNRSSRAVKASIPLRDLPIRPKGWTDRLNGQECSVVGATIAVTIPAKSGVVLVPGK